MRADTETLGIMDGMPEHGLTIYCDTHPTPEEPLAVTALALALRPDRKKYAHAIVQLLARVNMPLSKIILKLI